MFGGVGVYAGGHFFALIDNDVLFFKVDDETRHEFVAARMPAWSPFGDDRGMTGYYQLPADLLEDPDALRPWVEKAIGVAARKKKAKKKSDVRSPKTKSKTKAKPKPKAKAKPKPKKR